MKLGATHMTQDTRAHSDDLDPWIREVAYGVNVDTRAFLLKPLQHSLEMKASHLRHAAHAGTASPLSLRYTRGPALLTQTQMYLNKPRR